MKVGVISDTHGYLNPEVPELFAGVDLILHAGDIGHEAVLRGLEKVAPVTAVRGNNDREGPMAAYPQVRTLEVQGRRLLLTHQVTLPKGPGNPAMEVYHRQGIDVVVFGHSHIARQEWWRGILFFNPGAAGKGRFRVVPSVGILELHDGAVTAAITVLGQGP